MRTTIRHKRFLVTGGTGSFGKYIVRTLLENDAKEVIVFSRDEDKQYTMQFEFQKYKDRLLFFLGDVRDKQSLFKAMDGVNVVFHAAALKQIPSTEYNPIEAVRTNVLGAENVVNAAIENKVEKVIAISTDKAVEPINTMGLTKALQERIIILGNKQRGQSKTKFSLVRYGNVVGSRGSVIPLFIKQIEKGGPVTLTHKEMTRFILTLSQAISLVFVALNTMVGGEIFIPKIPPLKVQDLAEVLIEALKPKNKNVEIIGLRPGEKLHETLLSQIESARCIVKNDYFILLPQIELKDSGYTYKIKPFNVKKIYRYSSDIGPFMTKKEINELLILDGFLQK